MLDREGPCDECGRTCFRFCHVGNGDNQKTVCSDCFRNLADKTPEPSEEARALAMDFYSFFNMPDEAMSAYQLRRFGHRIDGALNRIRNKEDKNMKYAIPREPEYKTLQEMTDEEFDLVVAYNSRPNGNFTTSVCVPSDIFNEIQRRNKEKRGE